MATSLLVHIGSFIMLLCSAAVLLYAALQFYLMVKLKYYHLLHPLPINDAQLPIVTIQLPLYNEENVVEQLLNHIFNLQYPKYLLDIQILDDSTDNSKTIIEPIIQKYLKDGWDITYIHRKDRKGFKAGALDNGLPLSKGSLIAIFDADFMPSSDFLLKIIPYFNDEKIGLVQSRWQFYNEGENILTTLQALQLNVHFTIEQGSRSYNGLFCQFNGTAGVWRKETIIDAGGWAFDTLTEDLDLSYRAQLSGWQIKYVAQIESQCELPSGIAALKTQQYRWMKGGSQTAKKLIPFLWASPYSFSQKWHGTLHLFSSSIYIPILLYSLLSVPIGLFSYYNIYGIITMQWLSWSLPLLLPVYYLANVMLNNQRQAITSKSFFFALKFPLFLTLSMGIVYHNAMAAISGWRGNISPFERTPKRGFQHKKLDNKKNQSMPKGVVGEGLLMLYFGIALYYHFFYQSNPFFLFHTLLFIGYSVIFFLSLFSNNK